jgi:hypothetical protein
MGGLMAGITPENPQTTREWLLMWANDVVDTIKYEILRPVGLKDDR